MKKLMLSIDVECHEGISVKGRDTEIVMVPFSGKAFGEYFNGEIIGTGVDTQKYDVKSGEGTLSARYILQGTDQEGNACRIFIENSQHDEEGWHPMIVTDSKCLCEWERMNMIATVDGTEKGVLVQLYGQEDTDGRM